MDQSCEGYDVNFIEDIADYLKCIICQMVLKDPVMLVDCGHRFCRACFENMKRHAAQTKIDLLCPTDRMKVDINKVFDDKGIVRVIMDLQVKCDHYLDGCPWSGELRDLERHLDRDCMSKEKEKTIALLRQMEERLQNCEQRLEQKDEEFSSLQCKMYQKEEEITLLKEHCKQYEDNFTRQISLLKHQFQQYINQSNDRHPTGVSSTSFDESLCRVSSSKDTRTIQTSKEEILIKDQISKIDGEIKLLHEHATNTQFLPNGETVFNWKIDNYDFYRKTYTAKLYSPKFYSSLNGHCLILFVKWVKGSLKLGVHFCRGIYGEVNTEPFIMEDLEFLNIDKNGHHKINIMSAYNLEKHRRNYEIEPGENTTKFGWGLGDFLSMPSLEDYIINDSLSIRCTLTPKKNY